MNYKKGFTLVEVLVAVTILVLVIGAASLIETKNISFSTSTKYQTQANGVASEGLNVVQYLADQSKLSSPGGDCPDPSNQANCPAGVYYINGSNELMRCANTLNPGDCTVPTEGIVKINNKDYTRKIVIE